MMLEVIVLKLYYTKKICSGNSNCKINLIEQSILREELRKTILRKAALIEKEQKKKNN